MGNGIELIRVFGIGGYSGWLDSKNSVYVVNAKTSNWALPEQDRKLEEGLMAVYKEYLEAVASTNNGRY